MWQAWWHRRLQVISKYVYGGIRIFSILIALTICQGISSGFAAIGLTVGLDEARGEPVSWIGYIGSVGGAAVVGGAAFQVSKGYKASRAAGKVQIAPPKAEVATTAEVAKTLVAKIDK